MDPKMVLLLVALTGGLGGAGGSLLSGQSEVGKIEEAILTRVKLDLAAMVLDLDRKFMEVQSRPLPPEPVRRRLLAVERWIQTKDPDWNPPSTLWSEMNLNTP